MWTPFHRHAGPPRAPAATDSGAAAGVGAVPVIAWAGATEPPFAMRCPNCASKAPKTRILTVTWQTPDHPPRRTRILRCPACDCRFYDDQTPPDYADTALLERGRVPFYLQQGAGLSLLMRPLTRLGYPPGAHYLEVGCGFGFGLDFAKHTRHWHGQGIDPAPLAALGQDLLGVAIHHRYLEIGDADRQAADVIMASETIEHVPSPIAFTRTLRAALKPGGTLVLTTPDADALVPATAPGALAALLSPGLHLVFQSAYSLTRLLRDAGFGHVTVERDSHALVAYASDQPIALDADVARVRSHYRDYLESRGRAMPSTGDLFFGFMGRALQDAMNDGDMRAAARVWAELEPACRERFGLDLDRLDGLPDRAAQCGLAELAGLIPLNLAGLIYARAVLRLAQGETRPAVEAQFRSAANAAAALRRALGELALEDVMTEDIGWTAQAEAVLCAATRGAADIVSQLAALASAPGGAVGLARRRAIGQRAFTALMHGEFTELASAVAQSESVESVPSLEWNGSIGTDFGRELLLCVAMLKLRTRSDLPGASDIAAAVRRALDEAAGGSGTRKEDFWTAARIEAHACVFQDDRDRLDTMLADLAATVADPAALPADLLALHASGLERQFVNLVNHGRHEEARALAASQGWQARFLPDELHRNLTRAEIDVLFCLAMLDLQAGGDRHRGRARLYRLRAELSTATHELFRPVMTALIRAADPVTDRDEIDELSAAMAAAGSGTGRIPVDLKADRWDWP